MTGQDELSASAAVAAAIRCKAWPAMAGSGLAVPGSLVSRVSCLGLFTCCHDVCVRPATLVLQEVNAQADSGDVVKVSVASFSFAVPVDGLPSCQDWLTLVDSLLSAGLDLAREPISANFGLQSGKIEMFGLSILKGFTRLSAAMWLLLVASATDLESEYDKLKPLFGVLDRIMMIPVKLSFGLSKVEINNHNLLLSFRGSERQAPSVVTVAMRLADNLEEKQRSGHFPADFSFQKRLESVIQEFHDTTGMLARWHLDDTKRKAVSNFIQGTSPAAREVITQHLHTALG